MAGELLAALGLFLLIMMGYEIISSQFPELFGDEEEE
tara:strand:+ start:293 stop:403 length:111 start_codon:yes stop_codon:yes gene_type:complete